MPEIADLSSAALFELLCQERSVVGPAGERDEARAREARARELLLARPDAGHAIAAALPAQAETRAPLALHRHRILCKVARELLAALPAPRALEGILPRLTSAAPDVAEAVGLALLDKAGRGEAPVALLLAPGIGSVPRRRALVAVAKQGRAVDVLPQIQDLARRDVDRDLCLEALASADPPLAGPLATLARGDDRALGSAALEHLQKMRELGRDGGLALPTARELLQRADAAGAGARRAQVLCRVLLGEDAGDMAFACGDSGRAFATPLALVDGLRRWLALASLPRAADGHARPSVQGFDERAVDLHVPLPGGDVGVRPALGRLLRAPGGGDAEGPCWFSRAPVHGLQAARRTLYGYRFGTWIEGADPHDLALGELFPPGEDPLGLAGPSLRPAEAPSPAWFAQVAERLGRLRAGRYLAALIDVTPVAHLAGGPRPFWVPTPGADPDEDDEEDDDGPDAIEEAEAPPPFRAPFHVAGAAEDDVAIAFLPVFSGAPGESADLCVAYAWPRPEPGEIHPSHAVPRRIRLYAAVFAGEGALVRAAQGGPPARVLCVAPCALPGDDARLARAFAALGAVPIASRSATKR